ncbi:PD-(D/E)XK nuclease family protein [Pseudothauera nasutitermitis]|uniref:PD-(D/E)XK nuclease family protein n=1 Tax=Pseudothauera nasutitermitis TaxID=2565930 RepID=A0A4S4APA5_9RHOO|nr:PD-(D/E)XK nuclease family protein [Pseudothauera nasutitermitis]THF61087.1 PD-(D/E)XK nuclease family protein [Pseudothauera nasutitermitis]
MLEWAVVVILAAVLLAWAYRLRRRPENAWMPRELRRATLAYAEQLFKAPSRVMLTAKVDRTYRDRSGILILVELKTRRLDRPYLSDVIELSAQRVAIMRQTGEPVAMHGYVVVQSRPGHRTSHRVALLTEDEVDGLIVRWEAIVGGHAQPRRSGALRLCRGCGFAGNCANVNS